ncbi:MAG: hypothetical protein LBF55_07145, partial [Prevotellaceae bacterium]|nr:hypothetical protein [Prevotellaceae bacterium]
MSNGGFFSYLDKLPKDIRFTSSKKDSVSKINGENEIRIWHYHYLYFLTVTPSIISSGLSV